MRKGGKEKSHKKGGRIERDSEVKDKISYREFALGKAENIFDMPQGVDFALDYKKDTHLSVRSFESVVFLFNIYSLFS